MKYMKNARILILNVCVCTDMFGAAVLREQHIPVLMRLKPTALWYFHEENVFLEGTIIPWHYNSQNPPSSRQMHKLERLNSSPKQASLIVHV